MKKSENNIETWLQIILGVLAIFAIKAIFENDKSKIISKKGYKFLSDEDKMKEINGELNKLEKPNNSESHQEIII